MDEIFIFWGDDESRRNKESIIENKIENGRERERKREEEEEELA